MKGKKLDDSDIIAILNDELSQANTTSLEEPLAYYLGLPNGTEVEGRSSITSTDVADAIEWILPQIMKSFTQNNEVVVFDPINADDELQAAIESEYVYDILMKQNNGFILIHQFVKDALLQRNGILKVYYEESECTKTYSYTGLTQDQMYVIAASDNVEIKEQSVNTFIDETGLPQTSFDVKLAVTKKSGQVKVDAVSPEEFRVNSQHNSIDLSEARFTAHILSKTISDLLEEGIEIDANDVPIASNDDNRSAYRFAYQDESVTYQSVLNGDEANKIVDICECYRKLDVDGSGYAELHKVTGIGVDTITKILDIEPIDSTPWVGTTAILMSHKFQGLSIYDRLKQIQDNKTAIIRNIMDNMYLQNNQRNVIIEGSVNIDDLLVSRPGGIIRAKRLDAIKPLETPQIGDTAFSMMKYLDDTKAGRVGVSADGNATPENIGDRIGSEGLERMMNAKEELVGLIVRVICETGIKPLCNKIRDLVTQHTDTIQDFQYKGQWIKVNPATWPDRTKSTVRVGTGTGDTRAKLAAIEKIQSVQATIIAQPGQALTDQTKIYAALDDFCKFSGLHSANRYFIDPNSDAGRQATQAANDSSQQQQQLEMQKQLEELKVQQQLVEASLIAAKAQQDNVTLKGQVELAKHQRETDKQAFEAQIASLTAELEQTKLVEKSHKEMADLQFKYDELASKMAIELTKIEATSQTEENANYQQNEGIVYAR